MSQPATPQSTGNSPIGTAIIVYGQAQAQSPDGATRQLQVNSPIFANDRITTGGNGMLSIVFSDPGKTQLDLGRMSDMVINEDVYQGAAGMDFQDTVAHVQEIQEALLEGDFDPTVDLAAAASGPASGTLNAGGGISYVKFALTGEEVTPESGVESEIFSIDFPEVDPAVLSLAAEPVVESITLAETSEPSFSKTSPIVLPEPIPVVPPETTPGTPIVTPEDPVEEPVEPTGSISRVVEEEALDTMTTALGEIVVTGETTTSVDHWYLTHDGGSLTIDLLSEAGKDLNGDGNLDQLDTFVRLFRDDGSLDGGDQVGVNDDSWSTSSEDGSITSFDSFLSFSDLPAGNYILAVGDYYLSINDVITGVNIEGDGISSFESTSGPYQISITGNTAITGTPENGHITGTHGGNPDDNDLNPEDADQPDSAVVTGNILDSDINFGDESPVSFALNPVAELPTLLSRGEEVNYFISGDTLQAIAGERMVFTLQVEPDGDYTFTLLDTLDHVEPAPATAEENADLQLASPASDGSTSVTQIDFSPAVTAADGDGNPVTFPEGTFLFTIEDDIPIAVDDVGSAFGYASYEGTEDAPPAVVFDVMANDLEGADGAAISSASVQDGASFGTVAIVDNMLEFTPGEDFSGQTAVTYTITDGDGDTVSAELVITEQLLKVGSNANDQGNEGPGYVVGAGKGTIKGGSAGDILIGDYSGASLTGTSLNLLLMLDTSGSMRVGSRLDDLKNALNGANGLFDTLSSSDAQNVRVHIVEYNTNSTTVGTGNTGLAGTYDLVIDNVSQGNPAFGAVDSLNAYGVTNYEAGVQQGLSWIYTDASPTTTGSIVNGEDTGGPLSEAVNLALFLTDGNPNAHVTQAGTTLISGSAISMEEILNNSNSDTDNTDEVQALQDWGTLRAIGLNLPDNSPAIDLLDQIDEFNDAVNASSENLINVLPQIVTETVPAAVGDDSIQGLGGDDLIFGDALFTDNVVSYLIAQDVLATDYDTGLDAGAGWAVFEALENDSNIGWTRTDTINFIQEHEEELGQSASSTTSGNDIIEGNEGDDLIFGQEGDDAILGGEGDDTILAGTGDDTVYGEEGDDPLLDGGPGDDQLIGGEGEDTLSGNEGNDILVGDDVDFTDPGDPLLVEDDAADEIDLTGNSGDDIAGNAVSAPEAEDNIDPGVTDMTEDDIDALIPPPDPIA